MSNHIPSRRVFEEAVALNRKLRHENLGFISAEHGFLPVSPPLQSLPESFQAWDEAAHELPSLFRQLKVRQALDALPPLPVNPDHLPDEYLLRASALVSIFMHAYVRVEASSPVLLPGHLMQAWKTISERLQRPAPFLSYVDLILYNWKLRDPALPAPMIVENLDLLIPTVGNEEERIFYLTQVEIAAATAPFVSAVIRSQEAAVSDDIPVLEKEFLNMLAIFEQVNRNAIHKINPNPHSNNYVDQVVWAKTVAPFAVPILPGQPGPSGTAAPVFHYMDAFFRRSAFKTFMGHEAVKLMDVSPPHWRNLVEAVREISVREHIERLGNRSLMGLYNDVLEAYAGDKGYLGIHRLKAYGFLELAFKAGRSLTIGGFQGLFHDKTWNQIDHELAIASDERIADALAFQRIAEVRQGTVSDSKDWISFIQLEMRDHHMYYQPGDRLCILPENDDEIIRLTLDALQAKGTETIKLNKVWQFALQERLGYDHNTLDLPLNDFLRFGRLRPLNRSVAKALYQITASEPLIDIIKTRTEDQWELWDLLQVLSSAGFDTKRLWKAELWEAEHITQLIRPETPRLYSIASVRNANKALQLSVTGLEYVSAEGTSSHKGLRKGTASGYIRRLIEKMEENPVLAVKVSRSTRFYLPGDSARPIVMFAGGSGIAPFAGFLQARQSDNASDNWLFLGVRTEAELHHRALLETLADAGKLELRVAFSREEKELSLRNHQLVVGQGVSKRINQLMEEDAAALWKLICLREEGGDEACFYICGRTYFADSVLTTLRNVIRRFVDSDEKADKVFYRLFASQRLMLDVFTTYSGDTDQAKRTIDVSDLVLHNQEANGYWMALEGKVFDLTRFAQWHAGGKRILTNNSGMDATRAYQSVRHHLNPEVDAILGMCEIGRMRRLDFGAQWAIGLGPQGMFFFSLEDAFRTWVRYLYMIVEMENSLANEFSFVGRSTTLGESPEAFTPLKAHLIAEAHKRFISIFLDGIMGEDLQMLWAVTVGLGNHQVDMRSLKEAGQIASSGKEAQLIRNHHLQVWLDAWRSATDMPTEAILKQAVWQLSLLICSEDQRCFNDLKLTVRSGVQVFEAHERDVAAQGGPVLLEAVRQVVVVVNDYYERFAASIQALAATCQLPLENLDIVEQEMPMAAGHGAQINYAEQIQTQDDNEPDL